MRLKNKKKHSVTIFSELAHYVCTKVHYFYYTRLMCQLLDKTVMILKLLTLLTFFFARTALTTSLSPS